MTVIGYWFQITLAKGENLVFTLPRSMVPEIRDYFDQLSRQLDHNKQHPRTQVEVAGYGWELPEGARTRAVGYSMIAPTMMQPKPATMSAAPKGKRPFEEEYGFLCPAM